MRSDIRSHMYWQLGFPAVGSCSFDWQERYEPRYVHRFALCSHCPRLQTCFDWGRSLNANPRELGGLMRIDRTSEERLTAGPNQ